MANQGDYRQFSIRSYIRERESNSNSAQISLFNSRGLPLGNLTSQLFANIYLDEFDQFVKHQLKVRYYLRYTDDFIIVSQNENELLELIPIIKQFLSVKLRLELHHDKITIRKYRQGIDFLGYLVLPHHTILRTKTKKRMLKRVNNTNLSSYLGQLKHCNGFKLEQEIRKIAKDGVYYKYEKTILG